MADLPPYREAGTGLQPESRPTKSAPRWLSAIGIILAVGFVVLIIVAHLTGLIGPGLHGPGPTAPPSTSVTDTSIPSGGGR